MSDNVLIYTNNILPASETFIRNPPLYFARYTPYFIGSLREDGLTLPEQQIMTANGSGLVGRIQQKIATLRFGDFGIQRLASRLGKLSPKILQAHYGHASVHALPLAQKLNIPFVVYYHGLDATTDDEHFAKSPYMRLYLERREALKHNATLFLTQSNFLRDCLIEQGFPQEKVRTHYIGTAISDEAPLPLSQRENIVLFVARLTKKKGGRYLIEAMRHVQQTYPDLKLVIVGDGPARERLEKQAAEQLANYDFIGWQTSEQVAEWMQKARIFSVPSVKAPSGDSEGFGMVFVEAQRWGTPVVSFAHGGIVESVADGETGLLAPEADVDSLTQHILRLVEDKTLWQQMSQHGYERVKTQFDVVILAQKLEAIYDELLGNNQ